MRGPAINTAVASRSAQASSEGPREHCRTALGLLDQLQEMLLDEARGLPLSDALRLVWAVKDHVWRSVWLLEPLRADRARLTSTSTGAERTALGATANPAGRRSGDQP